MSPGKMLYEDDHVQLLYRPGSSAFTLATFSNYGFTADGSNFWGRRLCEGDDIEAFGFVAKSNNWFPKSSMTRLLGECDIKTGKPLLAYGHSQGGYAALKYSAVLKAAGVVSCAPQFSIDPASTPKDRRFTQHFVKSLHRDMDLKSGDLGGQIVVVYDPYDVDDGYQMSLILGVTTCAMNLRCLSITNIGHSIMDVMRDHDFVSGLFQACLCRSDLANVFKLARRLKKASHSYGYCLADRLVRRGRPQLALGVLDAVLQNAKGIIDSPAAARRAQLSSKAYIALGMWERALELSEMAMRLQEHNGRFRSWHEECLLAAENAARATATKKRTAG